MPPEQQNQHPAPYTTSSSSGHSNPYDFIMNPTPAKRHVPIKSPAGMLFIIGAVAGVIALVAVIVGISNSGGSTSKSLVVAAEEQQEIVRVSKLQLAALTQQNAKNFATNTNMSMASDQRILVAYLAEHGTKTSPKQLAIKQDNTTDTQLSASLASNTLDSTLTKLLQDDLTAYKLTLGHAYKETQSISARTLLVELNKHADLLLAQSKQ